MKLPSNTFWQYATWQELDACPDKENTLIVLPVSSHCSAPGKPLNAEMVACDELVKEILNQLPVTFPLLILPSLSLSASPTAVFGVAFVTAYDYLLDVFSSVTASGFKKVVLLSASSGNEPLLESVAVDARLKYDMLPFVVPAKELDASQLVQSFREFKDWPLPPPPTKHRPHSL